MPKGVVSNISDIYPSLRDETPKNIFKWIKGRQIDDRSEGLWRIHDTLYDFTNFAPIHPGGSHWLETTKGTDITEAFESHHISKLPHYVLAKYAVREAKQPRLYKFTFNDDGFFKTFQRRIHERMSTIDNKPKMYSKIYNDTLLCLVFVFAFLTAKYVSHKLAAVTGLIVALLAVSGHNFLHQKQNWRRLMMNFAFLDYREWQISHVLSHHLYTNSYHDLELSLFEPHFQILNHNPEKQRWLYRYGPRIYAPLIYALLGYATVVERYKYPDQKLHLDHLLPLTIPLVMWLSTTTSLVDIVALTSTVYIACSFYYFFVGFTAAHNHPAMLRDGDILRDDMDWGLYQLTTVSERSEISGWHFMVQTHFGEHIMHHLCPTLDHGLLAQLKPILEETCKEFGVELVQLPWWKLVVGKFRQLARLEATDFSQRPMVARGTK